MLLKVIVKINVFMINKLLIFVIIIHFGIKEMDGGRFIKLNRFLIE
jgi:hypothetical protein